MSDAPDFDAALAAAFAEVDRIEATRPALVSPAPRREPVPVDLDYGPARIVRATAVRYCDGCGRGISTGSRHVRQTAADVSTYHRYYHLRCAKELL